MDGDNLLLEVMRTIRNVFEIKSETGTFTIENEILTGFRNSYPVGTYILIERRKQGFSGSLLNSGIYLVADELITLTGTKNEMWDGTIWLCSPPQDFIQLVNEIKKNIEQTPQSNKVSESFGIHSYSLATDKNGMIARWQKVYAEELGNHKKWELYVSI